jgi:uncharacterized protein (TIGR02285 family)
MLMTVSKLSCCWRTALLHISLVVFTVSAAEPVPVVFYSKMVENWLDSAPAEAEPVSFQALRLLLQTDSLSPRFIQVSHQRAEKLTKNDSSGCLSGVLDLPERRQRYSFSLPFTAVQGMRLYFNRQNPHAERILALANQQQTVSLSSILQQNRALLIGVDKDRSYGETLDTLLSEPDKKRNVVFRHSGAQIGELWRMLEEGRVDVVLEYPFLMADKIAPSTISLALSEVPAIEMAYIACHKGRSGQAIIQRLNQAIKTHRFSQAYLDVHLSVVPAELQADYLQQYRQAMQSEDR